MLVTADDAPRPGCQQDLRHGRAGRAAAGGHDPDVFQSLPDNPESVDKRGQDDDRRAVLVVVEDGNVELVAQALLDRKAARRCNVLEVDASEAGGDCLHDRNDRVDVLRRQADRESIDPAEVLEEHCLAFHHGQGCLWADVAQPEHRRAIGDDGDHVLLDRERPRLLRIVGDRLGNAGNSRRVHHRQIFSCFQRRFRDHLDLAAFVQLERAVRDVEYLRAVDCAHRLDDSCEVRRVCSKHGDVADLRRLLGADEVDGTEGGAGFAHRRGESGERTRTVLDADPHGGTEGRR